MKKILGLFLTFVLSSLAANAKLVAWYPLDESPSAPDGVPEIIADNDATTVGFDADPGLSLITRGHSSFRQNLGCSYLLAKGGGFNLGGAAAVQPTDKFTIAFWLQPLTFDAFDRFFESQVNNDNGQDGLRIDLGTGNRFRVLVRDGNGAVNSQSTHPVTLKSDGTWYFAAFRYDSAGIDNPPFQLTVIEATADQVDAAAVAAATAGPVNINTGAMNFPHAAPGSLIGIANPEGTGGNSLNAALDEIAFWDNSDGGGVLTDQQLADVYNFGPSGVELITAFTTDLNSVAPGSPATLSWEVNEPFDTLSLDDGAGNLTDVAPMTVAGVGSIAVTPSVTTRYSLRATRGEAANVFKVRILAGAPPSIDSFTAAASVIQAGSSVDLSWTVTGADSLTLDPGAADVTAINSTSVTPAEDTTYTLSAINAFGTTTADVAISVITGLVPTNRYVASTAGNTDSTWSDEIGVSDWAMTGATLNAPLATESPNTNITAAYTTGGGTNGGAAGSFQYGEFTAEVWIRPSDLLGADHEVIFESGGGQNGVAALMTASEFRFLGSVLDLRTLDLTIPTDGLNLADFIQIVFSTSNSTDAFEVAIRDTFGNVITASETADINIGGNGAGLMIHAAGALGGDNNLGGRTEAVGVTPAGLTGFSGEIGILNLYDRILDEAEIQSAFDSVATTVDPPTETPFAITEVDLDPENDMITLTWNSLENHLYDAQFTTDLTDWFNLDDTITATSEQTTRTYSLPPNQDLFYLRIFDLGED